MCLETESLDFKTSETEEGDPGDAPWRVDLIDNKQELIIF